VCVYVVKVRECVHVWKRKTKREREKNCVSVCVRNSLSEGSGAWLYAGESVCESVCVRVGVCEREGVSWLEENDIAGYIEKENMRVRGVVRIKKERDLDTLKKELRKKERVAVRIKKIIKRDEGT